MWILDPAPGTKYSEVTDIWLLASKELIGCLVEKLVKINTVDDMSYSINSFRPELYWCLVFIEHRPSDLNECSVLVLHDAILLRCVRSGELMSDSQCIQVKVEAGVLELCAVVTPDMLDLHAIVVHVMVGEASEDILHFGLVENYVHPCIS